MFYRLHADTIIDVITLVTTVVIVGAVSIVNIANFRFVLFIFIITFANIITLYLSLLTRFYGIQGRRMNLICLKIYCGKTDIAFLYYRRIKRIKI